MLLLFLSSCSAAAGVTVSVPGTSSTGRFNVNVTGGYQWTVYQRKGGGTWESIGYGAGDTPFGVVVMVSGTYSYRVYNCFPMGGGCAYSNSRSIVVQIPPPMPSPPIISGPSSANSGNYSISWGAVSGATSYYVEEKLNNGSWVQVQQSSEKKITRQNQINGV